MFTDTFQNLATPLTLEPLSPLHPVTPLTPLMNFTGFANPQSSFPEYKRYRELGLALIETNSSNIFYRVHHNEDPSNGEGIHEKFIYNGKSVLDVSMGRLDYPWYAADGNHLNEITRDQLTLMANQELNPLVANRLRILSHFAATLLPHVRYFHYQGADGTRALTVSDEFNGVKLNCILTHTEELVLAPQFA